MSEKYGDWTNRETWCVHLWLTNEPESYNYCRELAESAKRLAQGTAEVRRELWTVEEAAKFTLADTLKDMVTEEHDLHHYEENQGMASMYSDLLGSALDKINWDEIANAFLDN